MRVLAFAALASLAAATAAPAQAPAQAPSQASVERGRQLYMDVGCYQCHGTVGQGAPTATRLAPDPHPFIVFSALVRQPPAIMPPYAPEVLSDAELADIHAYLQSQPPAPPVASLPQLAP